jgi:hypothetical protein
MFNLKANAVVMFVLFCSCALGGITIETIGSSAGMTGIDFTDYESNTYHLSSRPMTSMISDHGLKIDCLYTDGRASLIWNGRNADTIYAGPALVLVRTDLPVYPNPLELTFWAKNGSGIKAKVSSIFLWFLVSYSYDVELYGVDGAKIGNTIRIAPSWNQGIGFRSKENSQEVSSIHKVLIRYVSGLTNNWCSISGDTFSQYDIYYKGYTENVPSCAELQNEGLGMDADLDGNCMIDFKDLAIFVNSWLLCNDPQQFNELNSECAANW